MDAVLGFATTRTTVGFVLVDGQRADGAPLDCGTFRAATAGVTDDQLVDAYEHMANRVWLQMRTIAAAHRVRSVGVTWSDDAEREALLLRKSLTDAGLDNVVAVGLWGVGYALARASGYEKTAVCVIEPETAIAFLVDPHGALKIVRHPRGSADGLVRWLAETFSQDDWHPDGLVVAGSDADCDAIMPRLKQSLPVPVCSRAQAQSALAFGAAHASAHGIALTDSESAEQSGEHSVGHARPSPRSHTRAVLLASVLAVVVLLSLGIGPAPASNKPLDHTAVTNTLGGSPAVPSTAPSGAVPVQQLQAPAADTPPASAPAATPTVAVDVSPPARSGPQLPASLPTVATEAPVTQQPVVAPAPVTQQPVVAPAPVTQQPAVAPAPVTQQPAAPPPPESSPLPAPPSPAPPQDSQPPRRSDCFILCGTAL